MADVFKSDWVRSEAGRAQADRKLIPVKLPNLNYNDLPPPFDVLHTENIGEEDKISGSRWRLKPRQCQTLVTSRMCAGETLVVTRATSAPGQTAGPGTSLAYFAGRRRLARSVPTMMLPVNPPASRSLPEISLQSAHHRAPCRRPETLPRLKVPDVSRRGALRSPSAPWPLGPWCCFGD